LSKKRNKKVETIKIEGLSADTIKEFSPKEDPEEEDKLWEEYFRGSSKVLGFPSKQTDYPLLSQRKGQDLQQNTTVGIATAVTVLTDVTEVTKVPMPKSKKLNITKEEFVTLDSTHTKSEQMVYSIMYRETIFKGKNEEYFSLRKLMKKTGIGSDKTVFNALKGLGHKLSIKMVEHSNNKPIGTLYRVFTAKEIFKLRDDNGILIDINTKRIVRTAVTDISAVTRPNEDTLVKSTAVTSVENTLVDKEVPYIKENNITNDDTGKTPVSSLNNKQLKDDDIVFDHKKSTISLYKKYTGDQWRVGDNDFYQAVKDILPEIIEAAIISSILRSKVKISSFAYCEGIINEFKDNLTPGYLGYLREKWKEMVKQKPEIKKTVKLSNKERRKR
jgi:hypothetical protein